ncbi:MAG: toxin-antitoxin system YwqK family antitoxin [Bacteroidales bacterium]|nr:toxin-antitoxin system YwqK family antitoxin [Bacteroidales bacterium]
MNKCIARICLILFVFLFYSNASCQDTIFNQADARGLKQGFWKKYFPDGNLMYTGFFKDDKPVGEMKRYYESGGIKALMHFNENGDFASVKRYYENGTLASDGFYKNSKKDSLWNYYSYYDKKLKSSETFKNGIRQGFQYHYFPSGEIFEKTEWKNDLKDGIWEQYFEGGKHRLKATFEKGKLTGTFIVYFPNGMPMVTGYYSNNTREGQWVYYNENGTVSHEISYVNGRAQNEQELDEQQQQYFREIEENIGRFTEPDPNTFFQKNRSYEYDF